MSNHRALSGTPAPTEYSPYHLGYLSKVLPGVAKPEELPALLHGHEDDAQSFLELQLRTLAGLTSEIPAGKENARYAPGKWTVRELLGHIADTERILNWRALAAARGDKNNIQPFEQDDYVAIAGHDGIPVAQWVEQLEAIRKSSLALLSTFGPDDWRRLGRSNGFLVSARAWAFVMGCHLELHLNTLRTKYLA